MSRHKFLDIFFITEVVLFGLIITGFLPREAALYFGTALVIYFLAVPVEDSLIFFVRSIPLFLALPITAGFDNFNTWRILAIIIFLKWFFQNSVKYYVSGIKEWIKNINIRRSSVLLLVLLFLAILSLIPAPDKIAAVKRIIYFLNFAVLGVVVYYKAADPVVEIPDAFGKNKPESHYGADGEFTKRLIRNSVIPVVIVAVVGYIQVISTYFIDIYQFMRIWGEGIQCRQFGEQWCNIAVWLGNTWFAYYDKQLSLRVFSLFPDSHSFPQFVLLGIPAVLVITTSVQNRALNRWWKIIALSFLFLIIILSGTRGIWAASIGVLLLSFAVMFWMKRGGVEKDKKAVFKRITAYLIIFFVAFSVAFPIFSSPQFLVGKSSDIDILGKRIRSIIDFGETSNNQRIEIWKKTLISVKERPLLGVGIGNYPVVLGQDIRLAKAGSSAHNLYLHIAAEMGLPAAIAAIWFLWLVFVRIYHKFVTEKEDFFITYYGASLLFVPWILIYLLTDAALFDERVFLIFTITTALILSKEKYVYDSDR